MGWNVRDSEAAMQPLHALRLDNWYPRENYVELREGTTSHVSGFSAQIKTLMAYEPPNTANRRLFAATNAGVYNVTNAGGVGAAMVARTNGELQYTSYGTSAGNYLYAVNGVDSPILYDGTTWTVITGASTPALTGVTSSTLIHVNSFKRRLFFIQAATLSFWYLAVDAVGGALTQFRLDPLCSKGGYLVAMGTWTYDGGAGPDDYAVFITSEGEIIVYAGTDPASASTWALVGVYEIGKPIGRKCFTKLGGDILILTEQGVFTLKLALPQADAVSFGAITNKIAPAFTAVARDYFGLYGWRGYRYPAQDAVIFNIPTSETTSVQFVQNVVTKAWTRFMGWNTLCFEVFNRQLYFGTNIDVRQAWTGVSDLGANIVGEVTQAPNYLRHSGRQKQITMAQPTFRIDSSLDVQFGIFTDFSIGDYLGLSNNAINASNLWDSGLWDSAIWGADSALQNSWLNTISNMGYAHSWAMKVSTNTSHVKWLATNLRYKLGGP